VVLGDSVLGFHRHGMQGLSLATNEVGRKVMCIFTSELLILVMIICKHATNVNKLFTVDSFFWLCVKYLCC